jgi:hypothetical protein
VEQFRSLTFQVSTDARGWPLRSFVICFGRNPIQLRLDQLPHAYAPGGLARSTVSQRNFSLRITAHPSLSLSIFHLRLLVDVFHQSPPLTSPPLASSSLYPKLRVVTTGLPSFSNVPTVTLPFAIVKLAFPPSLGALRYNSGDEPDSFHRKD